MGSCIPLVKRISISELNSVCVWGGVMRVCGWWVTIVCVGVSVVMSGCGLLFVVAAGKALCFYTSSD